MKYIVQVSLPITREVVASSDYNAKRLAIQDVLERFRSGRDRGMYEKGMEWLYCDGMNYPGDFAEIVESFP